MNNHYLEFDYPDTFILEAYENFFNRDTYEIDGLRDTTTAVIDDVFSSFEKIVKSWPKEYIDELRKELKNG